MALASTLLALAAATSTPAFPQTADPLEKVRCVREQVTGSLVQSRKVCHTEREWRRIQNDAQEEGRRIIRPGNLNDHTG
jgi:hypothetical protein